MMMTWMQSLDPGILAAAFAAGVGLGGFYFIALWRTVKRLAVTRHPARLMLLSFVVRLAVLLAGLYIVMDGHWERLAAAMVGFLLIRKILTVRLGPPAQEPAV